MKLNGRSQTFRDAVSHIQTENWKSWERTKWLLTDREFQDLQDEFGTDIVF